MEKSNKIKAKSARKPLKELANGVRFSSRQSNKKKPSLKPIQQQQQQQEADDSVVDRLLLVHSDISNLINQIDQLVVQAMEAEGTSKKGKEEINLFTNVLSDMHSSLKLWIPRFQNLLTSPTVEPVEQLVQSSPTKTFPVANEEMKNVDNSPVLSDLDSFVSPSPLVSWCPERTAESGRQLFLLTPLPRSRQLSSKPQGSSRAIFTNMDGQINSNLGTPSLLTIGQSKDHGLLEGNNSKLTPSKCCQPSISGTESSLDFRFVSPPKFGNKRRSMLLMTPRLKMSPPKSCVMLEPIKESCQPNKGYIYRKTPFRVAAQTRIATPYRSQTESSTLKYAEEYGTERKGVDAPLDCPISPPKSCVMMEPVRMSLRNLGSNDDVSKKPSILSEQAKTQTAPSYKGIQEENQSTIKAPHYELPSTSRACIDCTPLLKEPGSTICRGRQPGENTLKKELWTRFEAASSAPNVLRLDVSVLEDTSGKGFLDRLEEVFSEEADDSRA